MKANEFASRLKKLAPAKPALLGCGYGNDEADEFIESFACHSRNEPLAIASDGDSMLELLKEWYLPPWKATGKFLANLGQELRCEIPEGHILWQAKAIAIAQRTDSDDVLFEIPDGEKYAVVHLM